MSSNPGEHDVRESVRKLLGANCASIERFPIGLAHFVYDVVLSDGSRIVARLTRPETAHLFKSSMFWAQQLRPMGVPLANVIASDPTACWPVMILERLPGTDLQNVYTDLEPNQKVSLASRIAEIQSSVANLPFGNGYGFASSYTDPDLFDTWTGVLRDQLNRSRQRIAEVGIVDHEIARGVLNLIDRLEARLDEIPPIPFLDDTTTKNVIVKDGKLTGIVDVDCVCFGDPLFTLALTRVALLSRNWADDYVDMWFRAAGYGTGNRWRLDLYTALFAVGFLSEIGHAFNQEHSGTVDLRYIEKLRAIVEAALSKII